MEVGKVLIAYSDRLLYGCTAPVVEGKVFFCEFVNIGGVDLVVGYQACAFGDGPGEREDDVFELFAVVGEEQLIVGGWEEE
jgi:hypothetical protein